MYARRISRELRHHAVVQLTAIDLNAHNAHESFIRFVLSVIKIIIAATSFVRGMVEIRFECILQRIRMDMLFSVMTCESSSHVSPEITKLLRI